MIEHGGVVARAKARSPHGELGDRPHEAKRRARQRLRLGGGGTVGGGGRLEENGQARHQAEAHCLGRRAGVSLDEGDGRVGGFRAARERAAGTQCRQQRRQARLRQRQALGCGGASERRQAADGARLDGAVGGGRSLTERRHRAAADQKRRVLLAEGLEHPSGSSGSRFVAERGQHRLEGARIWRLHGRLRGCKARRERVEHGRGVFNRGGGAQEGPHDEPVARPAKPPDFSGEEFTAHTPRRQQPATRTSMWNLSAVLLPECHLRGKAATNGRTSAARRL